MRVATFGIWSPRLVAILVIRLLHMRSCFRRRSRGKPSSLTMLLSDRSIESNWFSVAARFSITVILFPANKS